MWNRPKTRRVMRNTSPTVRIMSQRRIARELERVVRHSRYAAGGRTQHERERLRRIRQMLEGRLTVSNGLVPRYNGESSPVTAEVTP